MVTNTKIKIKRRREGKSSRYDMVLFFVLFFWGGGGGEVSFVNLLRTNHFKQTIRLQCGRKGGFLSWLLDRL